MAITIGGVNLRQLCEWEAPNGPRSKHALAAKLGIPDFAPVSTTNGFIYSAETIATPFTIGGAQQYLQNPGCRPRFLGTQLYHQTSTGTYYIHRYTDGEVYVSGTTARDKSGTKISNSLASMIYPRGIRYCMVRLVGKGGSGGNGTLTPAKPASGGGGGATAMCCIKLPENGYAQVRIDNSNITSTFLTCGTFFVTASTGSAGGNGDNPGAGGSVSGGTQTADGILIAAVSGGNGGGATSGGGGSSISFTDYAPEGGTVAWSQSGGGSGSGKGGGGGASTIGYGGSTSNNSLNTNGSSGTGPGAGGSGGNYSSGSGAGGQVGAFTIWY